MFSCFLCFPRVFWFYCIFLTALLFLLWICASFVSPFHWLSYIHIPDFCFFHWLLFIVLTLSYCNIYYGCCLLLLAAPPHAMRSMLLVVVCVRLLLSLLVIETMLSLKKAVVCSFSCIASVASFPFLVHLFVSDGPGLFLGITLTHCTHMVSAHQGNKNKNAGRSKQKPHKPTVHKKQKAKNAKP